MGFENISFTLEFFCGLFLTWFLFSTKAKDTTEADHGSLSFSYDVRAPGGPWDWGNLNPEWKSCGIGKTQSPIALSATSVSFSVASEDLIIRHKPANATIKAEHDVKVEWTGDAGGIVVDGINYKLVQCHWHTPSEHTINGFRGATELHVVHKNAQGGIAVIGILYTFGPPDPFLGRIVPYVGSPVSDLGVLDPFWINSRDSLYYRYNGSLTTPPCSETVSWIVFKTVRTVAPVQVSTLKSALKHGYMGNARPIQASNGRRVRYVLDRPSL